MALNLETIHPADQLIMIMERIYGYGMTTTSGGNLSVKDGEGNIWITPGSLDKGSLKPHQVVCVKPDGSWDGPHPPSSEFPFHSAIYAARPDLRSVIHAHPPALVSFSLTGKVPDTTIMPQTWSVCGKVGFAPYAMPGSGTLAEKIAAVFKTGHNTVIMESHSIVVGGEDILDAFRRFETLDFCARIHIHASSLGEVKPLPAERLRSPGEDVFPGGGTQVSAPPNSRVYAPEEASTREAMCGLIRRAYDQMLFTSTQGTFSARMDGDSFVITPYGLDRKYLDPEDLVYFSGGAGEEGKTPSRSVLLHEAVYRRNKAVNAIMIAHPPHVMAYSVTGTTFDTSVMPEAFVFLKDVPIVPFGVQRSDPDAAAALFDDRPVVLFANDCIIVTGKDLVGCFDRLEITEYIAHSLIWANLIGTSRKLKDDDLEELKKFW